MPKVEELPKSYVSRAYINLTDRCNFVCSHCARGEAQNRDLSLRDLEVILDKIDNPFLGTVVLFGGEPRIHPHFFAMLDKTRDFFTSQGVGLANPLNKFIDGQRSKYAYQKSPNRLSAIYSEIELRRMRKSGELGGAYARYLLDLGQRASRLIEIQVISNGFGMSNPRKIAAIINSLYHHGATTLGISIDKAHQTYAQANGVSIDYSFLDKLIGVHKPSVPKKEREGFVKNSGRLRREYDITSEIVLASVGNGQYAVPIGRGVNLSWKERLLLTDYSPKQVYKRKERVRKWLEAEYAYWDLVEAGNFTNCYCSPAKYYRETQKALGYKPQNRFTTWQVHIGTDLSLGVCSFDVLPPLGNLREMSIEEAYQKAMTSKLFDIVATKGPQGLARELMDIPEEELKAWFLERTPCGLCEDLVKNYSGPIQELLDTPSIN